MCTRDARTADGAHVHGIVHQYKHIHLLVRFAIIPIITSAMLSRSNHRSHLSLIHRMRAIIRICDSQWVGECDSLSFTFVLTVFILKHH